MGSIGGMTYPGFCVGGKNPLATMWSLNIRRSGMKAGSDVRRGLRCPERGNADWTME